MPNRFWSAGRLGFYVRVVTTGNISRGDEIEILEVPSHGITLNALWRSVTDKDGAAARRAMETLPDIDEGWLKRLRLAIKSG